MKQTAFGPLYAAAEVAHRRYRDPYRVACPFCGSEAFRRCRDRVGREVRPHGYRVSLARSLGCSEDERLRLLSVGKRVQTPYGPGRVRRNKDGEIDVVFEDGSACSLHEATP